MREPRTGHGRVGRFISGWSSTVPISPTMVDILAMSSVNMMAENKGPMMPSDSTITGLSLIHI